jgi:hypothetical protein
VEGHDVREVHDKWGELARFTAAEPELVEVRGNFHSLSLRGRVGLDTDSLGVIYARVAGEMI